MKRIAFVMIAIYSILMICSVAAGQQKQATPQTASSNAQDAAAQAAKGEKLFQTNCGRCHNPPQSISPREARAVVRHMRVRATLTSEDERLILKFLAP